jgi:hypothetical protein
VNLTHGPAARVSVYGTGSQEHENPIFNVTNLPANTTGHFVWSPGKMPSCTPYGNGLFAFARGRGRSRPSPR